MSGESPTKKARVSVEDKDMFPVTEGTQLDFEKDVDEEYEWKARLETARLEAIEDKLKIEKKAEDNEKIEETIEESEPSQPAKKKGIQTVGVESQSAMELEKVLKKVKKASEGSQDNMSAMMTGP
jgi:hypothetical protein